MRTLPERAKVLKLTAFLLYFMSMAMAACKKTNESDLHLISNIVPKASAGVDQFITLPLDSVELNGTGTDIDGSIAGYTWTKINGPSQYTILNPNAATTTVKNLAEGVYQFELTVTDDKGASAKAVVAVTVRPKKKSGEYFFNNLIWQWNGNVYTISVDLSNQISQGYSLDSLNAVYLQNSSFNYWEEVPNKLYPFYNWQSSFFGFEKYFYYEADKPLNKIIVAMTDFDGAALNPLFPVSIRILFQ